MSAFAFPVQPVEDAYSFHLKTVEPVAGGMTAALTFKIFTHDSRCFFAKLIREPHMAARARHGLALAAALKEGGLDFILPPVPARQGAFIDTDGGMLALHPYIEAPPAREYDLQWLGQAVARLHGCAIPVMAPSPSTHIPFLERALAGDRQAAAGDTLLKQLLREHAEKLGHYLDLHRTLATQLNGEGVPTHGDIPGNILMPQAPALLLIDWDEAGIAPPERDMWFLWTQPSFRTGYRHVRPDFAPDIAALRHAALSFFLDGIALQLAAADQAWGDPAATARHLSERRLNAGRCARLDAYLAAPPA